MSFQIHKLINILKALFIGCSCYYTVIIGFYTLMCLLFIKVVIWWLHFSFIEIDKLFLNRQDVVNNTTPLKEVIQPHVLVRLPCYDFTPVTRIALDASLPCGLGQRFQALRAPMVWRAVCTRPGNEFTPTCWFGITSKFSFMWAGFSPQSELGPLFWDWLHLTVLQLFVVAIVSRV